MRVSPKFLPKAMQLLELYILNIRIKCMVIPKIWAKNTVLSPKVYSVWFFYIMLRADIRHKRTGVLRSTQSGHSVYFVRAKPANILN